VRQAIGEGLCQEIDNCGMNIIAHEDGVGRRDDGHVENTIATEREIFESVLKEEPASESN
jgi:hypothetical protein